MSTRRTKRFNIRLTSKLRLEFAARNFRVAKAHRSKQFKQLVFSVRIGPIRQIAIRSHLTRSRIKKSAWVVLREQVATSYVLLTIGLAGMTFFAIQASLNSQLTPIKSFSTTAYAVKKPVVLPRSLPTHISINSVNIDADITPVGLDKNGAIALPSVYDWVTGWYQNSPTPGELGPSVIVGHVDNPKGISVFWRLRYVQAGDRIVINRADGRTATFKVIALKQFDQSNFPTEEVYGNIGYAGLRLITCGGAFDTSTGAYTQNTVVYAILVP